MDWLMKILQGGQNGTSTSPFGAIGGAPSAAGTAAPSPIGWSPAVATAQGAPPAANPGNPNAGVGLLGGQNAQANALRQAMASLQQPQMQPVNWMPMRT